jgi:hypothetical protein
VTSERILPWLLAALIVMLYGIAGALDNPDSEVGQFVDNLTLSN